MRVVRENRKELQSCYESSVDPGPALSGRITVVLELDKGRARDVAVVEDTVDSEVADCLVRKIERWRFPKELEGELELPFVFEPS